MSALIGIVKYQAALDRRAPKTYVLLAIISFLALGYGFLLPKFASGYFFTYVKDSSAWMYTTSEIFNTIVIGLAGVFVGGFLGSDVIAEEFETGSAAKLFSLPVRRRDVYLGKLLEKVILATIFALLFVGVSIICAYTLSGPQGYFEWLPIFISGLVLLLISFASIGFLFGSIVKQTSFVFAIMFGIWIFFTAIYGIAVFKTGMSYATYAIPFANSSMIPGAIFQYATNHAGVLHFNFVVLGTSTEYIIQTWKYAALNVIFSLIEVTFILGLGLVMFRRMELKG